MERHKILGLKAEGNHRVQPEVKILVETILICARYQPLYCPCLRFICNISYDLKVSCFKRVIYKLGGVRNVKTQLSLYLFY